MMYFIDVKVGALAVADLAGLLARIGSHQLCVAGDC